MVINYILTLGDTTGITVQCNMSINTDGVWFYSSYKWNAQVDTFDLE